MKRISLLYLVIRNLSRKPYRTLALALCVIIATGTLFAATVTLRGVQKSLEVGLARLGADVIVVPQGQQVSAQEAFIVGQPTTFYMDANVEQHTAALPGVARVSAQVFVQTLRNASCCVGDFFLVSFDPSTDFTIRPWLGARLAGRPLHADEIIVGSRILLHPGETAIFFGTPFKVADELESTGLGLDRTVFMPIDSMRQMIGASPARAEKPLTIAPNQISAVLVQVRPGSNPKEVAETVERYVPGVQAITASQMNLAISQQFSGLFAIILAVTASLWLMSLILIALAFTLIVNERQRELGLLRAMGARQGFVFRLILSEAALLTGLASAIGLVVSVTLLGGLETWLARLLHIPFLLPAAPETLSLIIGLLGLALFSGALASLQPAWRISRLEPYDAIRQCE